LLANVILQTETGRRVLWDLLQGGQGYEGSALHLLLSIGLLTRFLWYQYSVCLLMERLPGQVVYTIDGLPVLCNEVTILVKSNPITFIQTLPVKIQNISQK